MPAIGQSIDEMLRSAGLRPTAQRKSLCNILFGSQDRHVSAESLFAEARSGGINVSLATVYNTLNQLSAVGLLNEICIEGDRAYYDTNTSNHFHMLDESSGELFDLNPAEMKLEGLPDLPPGKEISRIDIVVRLKTKS